MASKKIIVSSETGDTVYCMIKRESNGWLLDDTDGGFRTTPADPYLFFVEDSVIKGRFNFSENRLVWVKGLYSVTAYKQNGASPSPINDTILGIRSMYVKNNAEVIVEEDVSTIGWSKIIPTISVTITQIIGE
jgi:hypothetical protein